MVVQKDRYDDQEEEEEEEEHDQERDLVTTYVADHMLESSLNDVINQVVASRPEDPFLMLSSLLYARATAKRGISFVQVCEVLDASGEPTILVRLHTGKGIFQACCSAEARGITDQMCSLNRETLDTSLCKERCSGRGFSRIAAIAQTLLTEKLMSMDPSDQTALDAILHQVETTVGRNVCLATSLAICQAGAKYVELSLREHVAKLQEVPPENQCVPMPLFSIINGGKYASSKLYAQEIMMIPTSAASFADAMHIAMEFNTALRVQLDSQGVGFTNRGAFGGFAPQVETLAEVFRILHAALYDVRARLDSSDGHIIAAASASPLRIDFGIDFAASEYVVPPMRQDTHDGFETPRPSMYNTDRWVPGSSGALKTSKEMLDIMCTCVKELGLVTIVDPFDANDVKTFTALHSSENDLEHIEKATNAVASKGKVPQTKQEAGLGGDPDCRVQIVGRDVMNRYELTALNEERACNTVLFLLHHFPTVSKLLQAITEAQRLGLAVILGVSSGQLGLDADFLSAFAMGTGVGQVKFGGVLNGEALDRYRKLLFDSQEPNAPSFVGGHAYRRY